MNIPTRGETFSQLIEHLRKAQESAATMSHLTVNESAVEGQGWLAVSEQMGNMVRVVTRLATRGLQ